MAEWWPFDRSWADEWKRSFTEMLSSSSAGALDLPQSGALPGDPFVAMVDAARSWLIGKKRTFRFSGHDLTLVLTDISVEGSDLARAAGQYGQVSISAQDIGWGGYQLERIEVQARNVHVRPGTRPGLVAAPVLCEAFVSASVASRWLAGISRRLELILQAGVPQIALAGVPSARLEVEAEAEGRSIRIQPRVLRLRDRRLSLRCPAFHVSLRVLPRGIMLTSVEPASGGFVVRGVVNEWQRSLSRADINRLLAAIRGGKDRLDI